MISIFLIFYKSKPRLGVNPAFAQEPGLGKSRGLRFQQLNTNKECVSWGLADGKAVTLSSLIDTLGIETPDSTTWPSSEGSNRAGGTLFFPIKGSFISKT